jgi:aminoglycoside/choline kinase family phosphotransferase
MTKQQDAAASDQSYDVKTLAKKHRIEIEDAEKIISQYGSDRKACDKAARRIAA